MANLVDWILHAANGEPVQAVVIGEMGWGDYGSHAVPGYEDMPKGKVLAWEEAKRWLSYEFYAGYGAPSCQAIYAWTKGRVIYTWQYDGSTHIGWAPRNPEERMPVMVGG